MTIRISIKHFTPSANLPHFKDRCLVQCNSPIFHSRFSVRNTKSCVSQRVGFSSCVQNKSHLARKSDNSFIPWCAHPSQSLALHQMPHCRNLADPVPGCHSPDDHQCLSELTQRFLREKKMNKVKRTGFRLINLPKPDQGVSRDIAKGKTLSTTRKYPEGEYLLHGFIQFSLLKPRQKVQPKSYTCTRRARFFSASEKHKASALKVPGWCTKCLTLHKLNRHFFT